MRKPKYSRYKDKSIKDLRAMGQVLGCDVDVVTTRGNKRWFLALPGESTIGIMMNSKRRYWPRERAAWIIGIEWVRQYKLGEKK